MTVFHLRALALSRIRLIKVERGFDRLLNARIALPAFILKFNMLDRHGIGVGVEIRQCLKLGDPTTVYLVRNDQLARFVVELNNDVLAKILEGHLGAEARAKLPDLVRPFFEFCIVSYATFERDCFIFGDAWRLAACARVAALAMLNNFGGAFERADPRNSGHVS